MRSLPKNICPASALACVVGYGLYKALVDRAYSSAMATASSSFLIVNDLGYSIASSLAILACSAVLAVLAWRRPRLRLDGTGVACMLLLAATGCASGLGLLGALPADVLRVAFPCVYGLASVISNAAWLVRIAALPAQGCLFTLAAAYLLSSLLACLLGILPPTAAAGAMALCGLASAWLLVRRGRPAEDGASAVSTGPSSEDARGPQGTRDLRGLASELANPLAVFVGLNLVMGLIVAFQVSGSTALAGASPLRTVADVAADALLLGIALGSRSLPDVRRFFSMLFPLVALALAILPFTGHVYGAVFGALLAFLQGVVSTSVLFLLLEGSERHDVPVAAAVGGISFVSRAFVLAGLLIGGALGLETRMDMTVRALIAALASVYLLALVLVYLMRSRLPHASGEGMTAVPAGVDLPAGASDERSDELSQLHGLTAREAQVALLTARGRSSGYIAGELGIAEGTARGYLKSAYAKLGVHSKQELIDLYTSAPPATGRRAEKDV